MTSPAEAHVRRTSDVSGSARLLRRICIGLACATYALIVLGAVVRANGAGLACPDWPLCFGAVVPQFNFGVALEWGHRLLASSVALGFTALAVQAARRPQLRQRLRRPLSVGAVLLAVQIVLGGLTVLLGLAAWTVTAHLLVGNAFFAILIWIERGLAEIAELGAPGGSRARVERSSPPLRAPVRAALAAVVGLLVVQVLLGGLVSSQYAGLACADFPSCNGAEWVPAFSGLVGIHVIHRLGAVALVGAFAALLVVSRRSGRLGRLAWTGVRLVLAQVAVGAANVLLRLPVEVTALHSALATALVAVGTLLVREALLARRPGEVRVAERGAAPSREALAS